MDTEIAQIEAQAAAEVQESYQQAVNERIVELLHERKQNLVNEYEQVKAGAEVQRFLALQGEMRSLDDQITSRQPKPAETEPAPEGTTEEPTEAVA